MERRVGNMLEHVPFDWNYVLLALMVFSTENLRLAHDHERHWSYHQREPTLVDETGATSANDVQGRTRRLSFLPSFAGSAFWPLCGQKRGVPPSSATEGS